MENENSAQEGQEAQTELSPTEQAAIQSGWVPKEEFHGDEHKWVDAAEYLRRGELFKKIELQSREIKDVRRALIEMKKLHSSVREVEYQRALDTLKAQKKSALEEGDADAVIAADERMDLVKEQVRLLKQEEFVPQEESGEHHPEFMEWKAKNSWYVSSNPMRAFADALGAELASSGLSPSQVLQRVEAEVKKEFPTKFRNPRQDRPGAVEGATQKGSSTGNFQLSPEERKVMQTFVRTGVMTEAEYVKELKRVKGS